MSTWHPLTVVCSKWQMLDLLTERSRSCKLSFLDWWMNLISAKEPWVCIGLSPICKKIWFDCVIRNIYCWIQRLCVKLSSRTGVNPFFTKQPTLLIIGLWRANIHLYCSLLKHFSSCQWYGASGEPVLWYNQHIGVLIKLGHYLWLMHRKIRWTVRFTYKPLAPVEHHLLRIFYQMLQRHPYRSCYYWCQVLIESCSHSELQRA